MNQDAYISHGWSFARGVLCGLVIGLIIGWAPLFILVVFG